MATPALLEKARLHIRRFFSKRIPPHFHYHDLDHTLAVAAAAVAIGRASGLRGQSLAEVELAALFHDTGYAVDPADHETESAKLATAWLRANGVDERAVQRIDALIMATALGHRPQGITQCVLRDADGAKAGQADFLEGSVRLRAEREALTGKAIPALAWREENLHYLRRHRFYTAYARKRFGGQKAINLRLLRDLPAAAGSPMAVPFVDRDTSWLAFNARVLQEAQNPDVPLLERLKFVAIHSSNLDEYYRVRVAQLRSLRKLGKWNRLALGVPPNKHIARINREALRQQAELGAVYRNELLPALRAEGIRIRNERQLTAGQKAFVQEFFRTKLAPLLRKAALRGPNAPFIEDRKLYLVVRLVRKGDGKKRIMVVNVPSGELGRFLVLPSPRGGTDLLYLDDAIRLCLPLLFKGWSAKACHAIKLSRDADLYLEEEYAEDVAEKVRRSLRKRITGTPARFLYDGAMPRTLLEDVRRSLQVKKGDLLEGGRYHNLNDLLDLPVGAHPALHDPPMPPLPHPALAGRDPFRALRAGDVLLHFPYHDFAAVTDLLVRAAHDPAVERIAVTLYRVAPGSRVCEALALAARNGKRVEVLMEVLARFDEGNNLHWSALLKAAGAHVVHGLPGIKVHAKLLLVERRERQELRQYAFLGTGNFNERTARTYADMALLTAKKAITTEVAAILRTLMHGELPGPSRNIGTAPHHLRTVLEQAIDREIEQAYLGRPAAILLKLNSLEDKPLIRKLYDADRAGVQVRLIVRGLCCLMTEVPGLSAGIQAVSIVDRFLEHARAYVFHNGGKPLVYLASADWMERNMDRRVETAFPVLDPSLRKEVMDFLELQWADNVKARILDREQRNRFRKARPGELILRSQQEWYLRLKRAGQESRH
jgi:polyphosphate kinase